MPLRWTTLLLTTLFAFLAPYGFAGDKPPHTHRFGDPLPSGAVGRLGTLRLRHGGIIFALAFTPDGKTVASAGEKGIVRLWNLTNGVERRSFTGFKGLVCSLAISPDGKYLAAANHRGEFAGLWKVSDGKAIFLKSPGGPRFTEVLPVVNPSGGVNFSPDGKLLAYCKGKIHICQANGKEIGQLGGFRSLQMVAFSTDGKSLAVIEGPSNIQLVDRATGKTIRQFSKGQEEVNFVAFSPDGKKLASGGVDGSVFLWEIATGKVIRRLKGHERPVNMVLFSPSGSVLFSCSEDRLCQWDLSGDKAVRQFYVNQGGNNAMALSPNGKLLAAGGRDGTIRLCEIPSGKAVLPFDGHQDIVYSISFSPDGKTLASAGIDSIRLWSLANAETIRRLGKGWPGAYCVSYSPGGKKIATANWGEGLQLWDVQTGKRCWRVNPPKEHFDQIAFSSRGTYLFTRFGKGPVTVRTTESGIQVRQIGHRFPEKSLGSCFFAVSPNDRVLALGGPSTIELRQIPDDKLVRRLVKEEESGNSAAFSPDGKFLAVGGGDMRLFEVATGKEVLHLVWPETKVLTLDFSPDGKTLASAGSDEDILLWEVFTGKVRRRFRGHRGDTSRIVNSIAFSPDGKMLASGGEDTTILLWDVAGLAGGKLNPEGIWEDLAGPDAARAYARMCDLIHAPEPCLRFLKGKLHPVLRVDPGHLARLIENLNSNQFGRRKKATQVLRALGEIARPALEKVLQEDTTPEARRRAEGLLKQLTWKVPPGEKLASLRGVELLEHIGTPEAQGILKSLAEGAPGARLTQESQASLNRLTKRRGTSP